MVIAYCCIFESACPFKLLILVISNLMMVLAVKALSSSYFLRFGSLPTELDPS